jgi:hypothetical protein
MADEVATITFEHSDGRKITCTIERFLGENEVAITTDFNSLPPEEHEGGLHAQVFTNLMRSMKDFSKDEI